MSSHHLREITFREAVREALCEEMERQKGMVIIGEDLLPGGGSFGVHLGMGERFGARMFESPISESAIVGVAPALDMSDDDILQLVDADIIFRHAGRALADLERRLHA